MKKLLLGLLALTFFITPVFSQKRSESQREEMRKEILEFKLKFLAQEIEIGSENQEKFFELYTALEDERYKLYRDSREVKRKVKGPDATEEDYEKAAALESNLKEQDAQLDKKYDAEFRKILSAKQLYKLKESEESFRKKMREMRHKERRGGKRMH